MLADCAAEVYRRFQQEGNFEQNEVHTVRACEYRNLVFNGSSEELKLLEGRKCVPLQKQLGTFKGTLLRCLLEIRILIKNCILLDEHH